MRSAYLCGVKFSVPQDETLKESALVGRYGAATVLEQMPQLC